MTDQPRRKPLRRWLCTAHDKVAEFRRGRTRLTDDDFIAGCDLPTGPTAVRSALAVRRAVANVGLVDSQFIRPEDRFPDQLGVLPVWDSLDAMSFLLELEQELGPELTFRFECVSLGNQFSVLDLVALVCGCVEAA